MKNTTRNTLFLFFLLTSINLFLPNYFKVEAKTDNEDSKRIHNDIAFNDILAFEMFNIDNKKFVIDPKQKYFVVLKNKKYCDDCFITLNNYVKNIKTSLNTKFICLNEIDSTVLDRKKNYVSTKKLLTDIDECCFQYLQSSTETFFQRFKTNYSPEILLINNGKVDFIPYPEIFDSNFENVSPSTQFRIYQFLK